MKINFCAEVNGVEILRILNGNIYFRLSIRAINAALGNTLSSLNIVRKKHFQRQLQAYGSRKLVFLSFSSGKIAVGYAIRDTIQNHGMRVMYNGYFSTFMRNMLRFALYEEFRKQLLTLSSGVKFYDDRRIKCGKAQAYAGFYTSIFLSGALAGAAVSSIMTPMDVIKIHVLTETIPRNCFAFPRSMQWIVKEYGVQGLYSGVWKRMTCSGICSAIGFCLFEVAKRTFATMNQDSEETKQTESFSSQQYSVIM